MNRGLVLVVLSTCAIVAMAADCTPTTLPAPIDQQVFLTTSAICSLRPTIHNADQTLDGSFLFTQETYPLPGDDEGTNKLEVDYLVHGLSDGEHGYHVHDLGDIFAPDGTSTAYHFIGAPTGDRIEIGLLNDGTPVTVIPGDDSTGLFSDSQAALNGVNDLIGRSIIIHGNADNDLIRVAQCVIGRTGENSGSIVEDRPTLDVATCQFAPIDPSYANFFGYAEFKVDVTDQNLWVKVFAVNAPADEAFSYTIHTKGDMSQTDGTGVGGIFTGVPAARSQVGNPGYTFSADSRGYLSDFRKDTEMKLNGHNSIVGRGMLLLDGAGAPFAQCVVGLRKEQTGASAIPPPEPQGGTVPQVTKAVAYIYNTNAAAQTIEGNVEFTLLGEGNADGPGVRVRYLISGLPPGPHAWHIHQYGNLGPDWDESGSTAGGHFLGYYSGRPNDMGVDMIGNAMNLTADADGVAKGEFVDCCLYLNGYNSIIGRSVVIHGGDSINPGATRLAWGVIGRAEQHPSNLDHDVTEISSAQCLLMPTGDGDALHTDDISGVITFTATADGVLVDYSISGLNSLGSYPWHIHDWGDVFDKENGFSVGGHFVGTGIRSTCPNESGRLNDGQNIVADALGDASDSFVDDQISLNGTNNIIGRAIIIHGDGVASGSTRSAVCVIGITAETLTDPGNPCDDIDCNSPNGECTTEWVRGVGQYVCHCTEDWDGDQCEINIECASPADCPPPPVQTGAGAALVPSLVAVLVAALFALFH